MSEAFEDIFVELDRFFRERNFEKSRRFHQLHSYNPVNLQLLLKDLGNPEKSFKTVHIAGTTGKGSTATYMARALGCGYKTGLYTSPHYEKINERIAVNETPISNEKFRDLWNRVRQHDMVHEISYFDALTAISMLYFRESKVEWAVYETGLGGRFDSTNNVSPDLCIITEIGMDHERILGTSIPEIAFEKAGIIKKGVPVYANVKNEEAREVLKSVASEVGSAIAFFENKAEKNYINKNFEFVQWVYQNYFKMPMPAVKKEIKGRLEFLSDQPCIIFDSAHNLISLEELIFWINSQESEYWNIYINLMKERNLQNALHLIQKSSLKKINIFLFPFDDQGYYQKQDILPGDPVQIIDSNELKQRLANRNISHVVTGSIKLYAAAKNIISEINSPLFRHLTTC